MRLHPLGLATSAFVLAGLIGLPPAWAQGVFSYVDENGVRVFTNIPPKNASVPPAKDTVRTVETSKPGIPAVRRQDANVSSRPSVPSEGAGASAAPASEIDPIIERYAPLYQLDPALVKSIIATESGFNSRAVSRKGARGLMQLMPATAARLGVTNPFDAEDNIRGGMKHLRTLLDTFQNDLVLSLAAYNAGENLVQRIGRVPAYRETHDYVRTVTSRYGKRSMSLPPVPTPGPAPRSPMFRFLDESGILQLTNIPPVLRHEPVAYQSGSAP